MAITIPNSKIEEETLLEEAPEKRLTLFAFQLAVLEKGSSAVGKLAFIWATVVLLGGFAITLAVADFLVVTFILIFEGARIFSRSHELEWQHENLTEFRKPRSILRFSLRRHRSSSGSPQTPETPRVPGEALKGIYRHLRTKKWDLRSQTAESWRHTRKACDAPIIPCGGPLRKPGRMSAVLYWLQLVVALASVALSLWRVSRIEYEPREDVAPETYRNRKAGLLLFYALALLEALLFLLERIYWRLNVSWVTLFERVTERCGFDEDDGIVITKRFYYDAFSRCLDGSVFDGLKMDLVSYGKELIASASDEEQFMGARIFRAFTEEEKFVEDTLHKIETNSPTIERLLQMLSWEKDDKAELRLTAAMVVAKLVGRKQNLIRVASIPGAIQSVSELLHDARGFEAKPVTPDGQTWELSRLGLLILRQLAEDNDCRESIGNIRGLVAKIIGLTFVERDGAISNEHAVVLTLALKVVTIFVGARGSVGETLRCQISENVFLPSNLRQTLRIGSEQMREEALKIVKKLAMDAKARERIGCTGGILGQLVAIFPEGSAAPALVEAAGDALTMLALESEANSGEMVRMGVAARLVAVLEDEGKKSLEMMAGKLLTNLCAYAGKDCREVLLRQVAPALPLAMGKVLGESDEALEMSMGLTSHILKLMTPEEKGKALVEESRVVGKLTQVLERYRNPSISELIGVPRMRRHAVELMIEMMELDTVHTRSFRCMEADSKLKVILDSTSALENFKVRIGSMGLCPYPETICDLVKRAVKMMASRGDS